MGGILEFSVDAIGEENATDAEVREQISKHIEEYHNGDIKEPTVAILSDETHPNSEYVLSESDLAVLVFKSTSTTIILPNFTTHRREISIKNMANVEVRVKAESGKIDLTHDELIFSKKTDIVNLSFYATQQLWIVKSITKDTAI